MDASDRGVLINRLADLMERDRVYLAVICNFLYTKIIVAMYLYYVTLSPGVCTKHRIFLLV